MAYYDKYGNELYGGLTEQVKQLSKRKTFDIYTHNWNLENCSLVDYNEDANRVTVKNRLGDIGRTQVKDIMRIC